MQNLVSGSLTPENIQAIMAAIQTIKDNLTLVGLTPQQRKNLSKLGDKSRAFVDRASQVVGQNPEIMPATFDPEEFQRDVAYFNGLGNVHTAVLQLLELVDDTMLAAGSDAFVAALKVYKASKDADPELGLDEAVAEMGERFAGQGGGQPPSS